MVAPSYSMISAHEYSCAHGAQTNFGDLTPYLTMFLNFTKGPHRFTILKASAKKSKQTKIYKSDREQGQG